MEKFKTLFESLKHRVSSFIENFKTFAPKKKLFTIVLLILSLAAVICLIVLLRSVVGNILIGIGVIVFIAGIVIGIKEKSVFLAIIIVLISMIPVGLGNAILPKEAEVEETTTEVFVRIIPDTTEPESTTEEPTTEAPTTTEPETTEAPTTTEPETTEAPTTTVPETEAPTKEARDYVVNTNTGKFHYPSCASVGKIKSYNRSDRHCTRDELIAAGYEPCGQCHP